MQLRFSLTPGVHTECLTSLNVQNEIQHWPMMSFSAQTVNTGLLYIQQKITFHKMKLMLQYTIT